MSTPPRLVEMSSVIEITPFRLRRFLADDRGDPAGSGRPSQIYKILQSWNEGPDANPRTIRLGWRRCFSP